MSTPQFQVFGILVLHKTKKSLLVSGALLKGPSLTKAIVVYLGLVALTITALH